MRFMSMKDPQTPWLSPALQRRILDFELVIKSRFPTETDIRFTRPFRAALQGARRRGAGPPAATAVPTSCARSTAWSSSAAPSCKASTPPPPAGIARHVCGSR